MAHFGEDEGTAGRYPSMKLEHFYGRYSEDADAWLASFETMARIYRWNDGMKVDVFQFHLKGTALNWLLSRNAASWAELKAAFESRFCDNYDASFSRLNSRQQGAQESVESYAESMQVLFRRLELPARMQLRYFLNGLAHIYQDRVISRRPESLAQAIDEALYFESYDFGGH